MENMSRIKRIIPIFIVNAGKIIRRPYTIIENNIASPK